MEPLEETARWAVGVIIQALEMKRVEQGLRESSRFMECVHETGWIGKIHQWLYESN